MTRSPAQRSTYKDLGRNGQSPAITSKATSLTFTPITRSPAQKSTCKDLRRNGQNRAITPEATYTPTSNRAGSRLLFDHTCVNVFHMLK
ncbi:ATP-dependent nuclease subunit B [Lacticaseibacillus rhamnosus]|nr:ATP-dependent nuclease subunit B [Lacticaseibacillus rhamnosus]